MRYRDPQDYYPEEMPSTHYLYAKRPQTFAQPTVYETIHSTILPDRPEVVPYYDLDLGHDSPAAHDAHPWSQPVPTPKKQAEERLK